MSTRSTSALLWAAAFLLAVVLAVFQRLTGPSHPMRGVAEIGGGESISYRLPRSDEGKGSLLVAIPAPGAAARATLQWPVKSNLEHIPVGYPSERSS